MNNIILKIEENLKMGKALVSLKLAKTLARSAPVLAGHFASLVWFTPLRHRAVLKRKPLPKGAVVREGKGVQFWSAGSPRSNVPTVVLVHGWGGSSSQFLPLAEVLLQNDFNVISFDFPAHGNTHGFSSDIVEMAEVLREVILNTSGDIHLICHSFGLLVAGQLLKLPQARIKSVTGIAAPVSFEFLIKQFMSKTKFDEKISEGLIAAIQRRVQRKIDVRKDIDLHENMFRNLECLFIYDEADKEVPFSEFKNILRLRPGASSLTTRGLGHNKLLASAQVSARIVEFLHPVKNYTGPQTPRCPP